MKRLAFSLTSSILTFNIGLAAVWLCFQLKPLHGINHVEHSFNLPELRVQEVPANAPFRLEKIADVPSDEKHDSFSIQVLNEQEIWISSEEKMWRTRDGGKNWKLVYDSGAGDYNTNDILHLQLANSKIGWLLTIKEVQLSDGKDFQIQLYRTEDGGDSWTRIAQPVANNFNTFQFIDEKHGWAVGSTVRQIPKNETRFIRPRNIFMDKDALYAAIYYTEDSGKSWRQQPIPSRPNTISDFSVQDANHGWAWGDSGIFYLDRGRWKEINYNETTCNKRSVKVQHLEIDAGNPYVGAESVSFINQKVGWMSHTQGYLAKTTDGGRTWCDLINPEDIWGKQEFPMSYFQSIKFFDSQHGYGFDEESVYETKDGGVSWAKLDIEMGTIGFTFTDAQHGWAVSKEGLFRIMPANPPDTIDSTGQSQSVGIDYYSHIKPEHREILKAWLRTKEYLRPAVEEIDSRLLQSQNKSDLEANLRFLQDTVGKGGNQYYSVGDMNHDGKEDFAVLLVDTRKQRDDADQCALVIFNAPFKKGDVPAYYEDGLHSISNCYIVFDRMSEKHLFLGELESDVLCATYYSKGKTYYFKDCLE